MEQDEQSQNGRRKGRRRGTTEIGVGFGAF